jgi:hypothetical protein
MTAPDPAPVPDPTQPDPAPVPDPDEPVSDDEVNEQARKARKELEDDDIPEELPE